MDRVNPLVWDAPWLVVAAGLFVIVMARANATYWLGRLAVRGAEHSRWARVVTSTSYQRGARLVDRWGPPVVALSFLTIGVQTMVNLAAGAARMKLRHYLPAVIVGSLLWAALYATVGLVGWSGLQLAWRRSPRMTLAMVVLTLVAGIGWWVATRRTARRRGEGGETRAV